MKLLMEVVSRQRFTSDFRNTHVFSEAGGYIGRSEECEWVLPDKGRTISGKHVMVTFAANSFFIENISQNDIFTESGKLSIKPSQQRKIEHGSIYVIGFYTVKARLLLNPYTYIQIKVGDGDLLLTDNALSLDPLIAMDQQDNFEARRRLGYYEDLLSEIMPESSITPPNHSSVASDTLYRVTVIPDESLDGTCDTWEKCLSVCSRKEPLEQSAEKLHVGAAVHSGFDCEVEMFFRLIGYSKAPESKQERERMLRQAADLLLAAGWNATLEDH